MTKRFYGEQIIDIVWKTKAGVSTREIFRKHAISDDTL